MTDNVRANEFDVLKTAERWIQSGIDENRAKGNLYYLRDDIAQKQPVWQWARGRYVIHEHRAERYIRRVSDIPLEPYNAFATEKLYIDLAKIDPQNDEEIEAFTNKYGLLGLAGWYCGVQYELGLQTFPIISNRRMTGQQLGTATDFILKCYPQLPITSYASGRLLTDALENEAIEDGSPEDAVLYQSRTCLPTREPLKQFQHEVEYLKAILALHEAARQSSIEALQDAAHNTMGFLDADDRVWLDNMSSVWPEETDEERALTAIKALQMIISRNLSGLAQTLNEKFEWEHTYQPGPPSLLPLIYLQLAIDIAHHNPIRRCKNASCRRFFSPTRTDRVYCSDSCKSADNQRAYRQRKKEEAQKKPKATQK